jgi:hypothetical protein
MKKQALIVGMLVWSSRAFAACDALPTRTLIDWGLHRRWLVERDCRRPEEPARLVEVPWSDEPAAGDKRGSSPAQQVASGAAERPGSLVRPGMRVTVVKDSRQEEIRLTGTALDAGERGQTVRVRAGWDSATLRGIVRGPALVELMPARGRN